MVTVIVLLWTYVWKLCATIQFKVVVEPCLPLQHPPLFIAELLTENGHHCSSATNDAARSAALSSRYKDTFSVLDLQTFSAPNRLTTLYQLHTIFNIIWNPYRINIGITIALSRNLASWPVPVSTTIQKSLYMASCLPFSRWLIFHNSFRKYGYLHSMNMLYLFILRPVIFPLQEKSILHTITKGKANRIGQILRRKSSKTRYRSKGRRKDRSDRKTGKMT
jgi:hypothetical protein